MALQELGKVQFPDRKNKIINVQGVNKFMDCKRAKVISLNEMMNDFFRVRFLLLVRRKPLGGDKKAHA